MEFASIYRSFGAEVTVLEMLPRVVPVEDEDISAELEKAFRKRGIRIETQSKVESVKKDAKGVTVVFTDKAGKKETLAADVALIAVGRRPMTENIGLEKTKAKVERGFVHVGPISGNRRAAAVTPSEISSRDMPQLAHAGSMEGLIAVGKMAGKPVQPFDRLRCPNATYCEPQVGFSGSDGKAGARRRTTTSKSGNFRSCGQQQGHHPGQPRRVHQSCRRSKIRRDSGRAYHWSASPRKSSQKPSRPCSWKPRWTT